jgi:hypothetical protein
MSFHPYTKRPSTFAVDERNPPASSFGGGEAFSVRFTKESDQGVGGGRIPLSQRARDWKGRTVGKPLDITKDQVSSRHKKARDHQKGQDPNSSSFANFSPFQAWPTVIEEQDEKG